MSVPASFEGFAVRDARLEDRPHVLEFTAHTWEFGDYIEFVYDQWVRDSAGRFIVAEEEATGTIVAIDKLTMLSPTEAWFEGLRVNPLYRGRGIAPWLQRYMIQEAKRLGAQTIRFLTREDNLPVHSMAYRDGFVMRAVVRFWKRRPQAAGARAGEDTEGTGHSPVALREATVDEAPLLFDWWWRSASYATGGLVCRGWAFGGTSLDEWVERAKSGQLFVEARAVIAEKTLPPPTVMVLQEEEEEGEGGGVGWVLAAVVSAPSTDYASLMAGLVREAQRRDIEQVSGLLPDMAGVEHGMLSAGFEAEERLCLFELDLTRQGRYDR